MITTGPYTPSSGVNFTVQDPANHTASSTRVQVQNYSGFSLSVSCNGFNVTIPAYFAATLSTGGQGQGVTITPSATLTNQTGTISLVWLLSSDSPPVPDGSLAVTPANARLVPVTWNNMGGGDYQALVPLLATDQALSIIMSSVSSGNISVLGSTSSIYYANNLPISASALVRPFGPIAVPGAVESSVSLNYVASSGSPPQNEVLVFSNQNNSTVSTLPGVPAEVYNVGGKLQATGSGAGNVTLLAAPFTGLAYRIHSVSVYDPSGAANGTNYLFCRDTSGNTFFANCVKGGAMTIPLNGLTISGAVYAIQSAAANTRYTCEYDTIATPIVS